MFWTWLINLSWGVTYLEQGVAGRWAWALHFLGDFARTDWATCPQKGRDEEQTDCGNRSQLSASSLWSSASSTDLYSKREFPAGATSPFSMASILHTTTFLNNMPIQHISGLCCFYQVNLTSCEDKLIGSVVTCARRWHRIAIEPCVFSSSAQLLRLVNQFLNVHDFYLQHCTFIKLSWSRGQQLTASNCNASRCRMRRAHYIGIKIVSTLFITL